MEVKLNSDPIPNKKDAFRRGPSSTNDATLAHRKFQKIILIYMKLPCFPLVSGFSCLITRNTAKAEISAILTINILKKY